MNTSIIATVTGRLRGRVDRGVCAFLGVPYAAAPFVANRLRPPRPVEPWSGLRNPFAFGAERPEDDLRQGRQVPWVLLVGVRRSVRRPAMELPGA